MQLRKLHCDSLSGEINVIPEISSILANRWMAGFLIDIDWVLIKMGLKFSAL